MSEKKKGKGGLLILAVVVVVALIVYGAYQGRNQELRPSDESFTSTPASQSTTVEPGAPATVVTANTATPPAVPAAPAENKELKIVKTWTRKDCTLAPWLITDKLGFFEEEGIKVVFTGELQPPQQLPSIVSGENDVATGHPNAIAVAIASGAPLKGVVRGVIEPAPELDEGLRHMWWFVNPEKYPNVKSFADLKDIPGTIKFSLISTNQCSDFLANLILDKYGIPRDKIEWVTMPDVQAIQALSQKLVDVGGVHPPFYKGMIESGAVKIADSTDAGLEPQAAGLSFYFFTEKFIKENPETVKGFVRAVAKGHRWINTHSEEARSWTEENIGVPVSANHYYAEDLKIIDSQVDPWLHDLEESGVIPKGKINSASLVTHEFEAYSDGLGEDLVIPETSSQDKLEKTSALKPASKDSLGG